MPSEKYPENTIPLYMSSSVSCAVVGPKYHVRRRKLLVLIIYHAWLPVSCSKAELLLKKMEWNVMARTWEAVDNCALLEKQRWTIFEMQTWKEFLVGVAISCSWRLDTIYFLAACFRLFSKRWSVGSSSCLPWLNWGISEHHWSHSLNLFTNSFSFPVNFV